MNIMSEENNEDKWDVLLEDQYLIRKKLADDMVHHTLLEEERKELLKKETAISNKLKERKGRDIFDLIKDQVFIRQDLWGSRTLTKEEREELLKKESVLLNEIKERKGEVQEMFERQRNMTIEERQQIIDNAEMILSRVKGSTPEMIKKSNEMLDFMKRNLKNFKRTKGICPHCRKPISLNARFCSKCGNKIENKN